MQTISTVSVLLPARDVAQRYLDLMKRALSYLLWDQVHTPIETHNYLRPAYKRATVTFLSQLLRNKRFQMFRIETPTREAREGGEVYPVYAHTMIGLKRLDNIQFCVENVLRDGIPGDLIETGVWRGGACILMRAVLAAYGVRDRKVFVADSFEGLPVPDPRYPQDAGDQLHTESFLAVSKEQVARNFELYGLLDEQVVFLKGWFKDTLPIAPIDKLSIMRLDGDMYQSTMDALTNLYSKLQPGGYCIIDDYNLRGCGCKQAVDDFRLQHSIREEIAIVDRNAVYWRKER